MTKSGQPAAVADWLAGLSPRQRQVAALVARGCSDKEIAERLAISYATVRTHVQRVYFKLGINGRVALTRILQRQVLRAIRSRN
jgi:DNA-binding CsgD family transcriptional regulator